MTPAQQATIELHAAFWGQQPLRPPTLNYLPARRYDMMKQEALELSLCGIAKAPKGHSMNKGKKK